MSESEPTASATEETILRVKSSSNASSVGAAVAHAVYRGEQVSVRAIGAGAVNQAVKALTIAQSFVGSRGYSLSFRFGFTDVEMPDRTVTAMLIKTIVS